jgi:5-methylcytosine-specific restriction endonuclease McrA
MKTQTCKKCGVTKPQANFRLKTTKYGNLQVRLNAHSKRTNDENISVWVYRKTLKFFEERCCACGCELGSSGVIDHLIPVAEGGKTVATNLIPLCCKCNLQKSAKLDFFSEEEIELLQRALEDLHG